MTIPRAIQVRTRPRRPRLEPAFTLIEMLVVISLIVIILGIVVPSVSRIMRSTNYASAVNAVTATLGRARAEAMASDRPTAVAFLFDIQTKTYTLQVLELAPSGNTASVAIAPPQSGDLADCSLGLTPPSTGAGSNSIAAYRPLRFTAPIALPPSTAVFGLSTQIPEIDTNDFNPPSNDLDQNNKVDPIAQGPNGFQSDLQQWYAGELFNDDDNDPTNNIVPWIFPRNDPRLFVDQGDDPWKIMSGEQTGNMDEALAAVRNAMSFAIAFRPDGSVSASFGTGQGDSPLDAYIELPNQPLDQTATSTAPPYDHDDQFDPGCVLIANPENTQPNPEVRLRTVNMLAVVDLQSLQAGAGVNEPWLVRPETSLLPAPSNNADPKIRFIDDTLVQNMSDWIDKNAQIIAFNRYTGATVKR